ncbi:MULTISPECIES: SusC/RagA family TonB-linked outer membrane protein [Niastella]|uniref:SusC/RagA family TonB-linked outer membrane protein n=1 Tax=Niastella soli TaxID=2821487 RepID=A0ABS3Z614_9BACT|nr:SusC/RagA family TonB-linked outer membrane protein [Niastella soli]MBO9204881.1 SusC/RagA family TonB-linked outer membrane protein [Niastella soli]
MKKTLTWLLTGCWLMISITSFGQSNPVVSGTVKTASSEKLSNVTVTVKGTNKAVVTDNSGHFVLSVSSLKDTLVFSYIGTQPKEVPINGQTIVNTSLDAEATSLSDVVVVGYMTQTKNKTAAAVSKLAAEEMVNTPNPNPVQALQGKLAGVSVPIVNGQPGSGANNILIRGGTKLNSYGTGVGTSGGNANSNVDISDPLVVIDGVFRSLNDINPDDIESFQVMKDAASTAAYGARGANGVIVIKTRSGKFNAKPTVTVNYRRNYDTQMRDYDYLSAKDYLTLARTTVKNTADALNKDNLLNKGGFSAGTTVFTQKGQYSNSINLTALYDNIVAVEGQEYVDNLLTKGWEVMDDPINPGTRLLYTDNHYQDMLWNTGVTDNFNASVNGGGDNANYNVSLGYVNQGGIFVGTNYKRYNALGNFGFKVSKNFKLDASVTYQNVVPNYVESYTNDLVRATRITPLIRIFRDDDTPTFGEVTSTRNRFHTLKYDDTRVNTERMISRLAGDVTITKGLHFRPAVSYVLEDYRNMLSRKAYPGSVQLSTSRQKYENTNNIRQLMIDQILQYDHSFGSHNLSVLAGFNYTRYRENEIKIGSQRATSDYVYTIEEPTTTIVNDQIVTNVTDLSTTLVDKRSASYFGQFSYDYDSRYLLSGSLRYDGFSYFAPGNKYALFPALSVGWNIHNETFWKSQYVSALKLRASWGSAGLNDLKVGDTYGSYVGTTYAQTSGIVRENLANRNLKWESTQTTDLAVDAGFMKNRIMLTVDFYNKLTNDRLASRPLPLEGPFASVVYNNGSLRNRGVEVELSATVFKYKEFTWKTNFSFAFNRTIVVDLPNNGRAKNRQFGGTVYDPASKSEIEVGGFAEGERPYSLYAFKVDGIFSTDAEAAAWGKKDLMASPDGQKTGKHAGDYIWADLNGDNIIDSRDMVFMGYRAPDKIGGMQNTFTFKSLTLRFAMDYALGHVISNGALARSLGQGRAFNEGAPAEALGNDIWKQPGDVGKKYARFSFADYDFGQRNYIRQVTTVGTNNSYGVDVSTMFEKGDFLAFREIYLGYELPKDLVRKTRLGGINVFGSIYNIGYLTKYKGVNPETYTGFDAIGYPRPRQFSLGATARF